MTPVKKLRPQRNPTTEVRAVICPRCHAAPGDPCAEPNGSDRTYNHRERRERYRVGITQRPPFQGEAK